MDSFSQVITQTMPIAPKIDISKIPSNVFFPMHPDSTQKLTSKVFLMHPAIFTLPKKICKGKGSLGQPS